MDLDSVTRVRQAFYRLIGSTVDDDGLTEQGETDNEVCYLFLTRGCRAAQRFMLDEGYGGWRQRSAALSFSGSDAADGGRYTSLPTDFLRAVGNDRTSALREADGTPWGQEFDDRDDTKQGNGYYLRGDQIWLLRNAVIPSTLYLDYHFHHPEWSDSVTIDFPIKARWLIVAEAADSAKLEDWFVGDNDVLAKIAAALIKARTEATDIAKRTQQPLKWRAPRRAGTHW